MKHLIKTLFSIESYLSKVFLCIKSYTFEYEKSIFLTVLIKSILHDFLVFFSDRIENSYLFVS